MAIDPNDSSYCYCHPSANGKQGFPRLSLNGHASKWPASQGRLWAPEHGLLIKSLAY